MTIRLCQILEEMKLGLLLELELEMLERLTDVSVSGPHSSEEDDDRRESEGTRRHHSRTHDVQGERGTAVSWDVLSGRGRGRAWVHCNEFKKLLEVAAKFGV